MCGIIGVLGPKAAEKAFEGLKTLEYRGYDSWGVAVPTGSGFFLERHIGKIGEAKLEGAPQTNVATGHTRWATHGKVTEGNAHPHLSSNKKIAIVHNGIVENFSELKYSLLGKKYFFSSETDSEVIANLIEDGMKSGSSFEAAFRQMLLKIEGSYAIAAINDSEDKILCAKNGSPLVIGIGNNREFFVASDATAFISHTSNAVFLEDGTMAILGIGGPEVFDIQTGKSVEFKQKALQWNFEQAKKGGFAHFMLKEIHEQPQAILAAIEQPEELLGKIVSMAKGAKKVLLLGCGSSYHACISGTYFLSSVANMDSHAILASEFRNFESLPDKETLVIAVSQSGETADLIDAIKFAKEKGARVAAIVNVMDSTIMRISDCTMLMNAGPEICVLSTKSYTSQLAILLLLAYSIAGKGAQAKEIISRASSGIKAVISGSEKIRALAQKIKDSKDIFVIGRGMYFPAALESALKIKEVSYIHAEGFAGAELKHGTIALVEEGTPAIIISDDATRKSILSNAIELKSRGAKLAVIDSDLRPWANELSESESSFMPYSEAGAANAIVAIVPTQLLSYFLAIARGLDCDKPRNLAKSVTVR